MAYLEYEVQTKQVVEIHETLPDEKNGYAVVVTDDFKPGDEFAQTIWVNDVDEDGRLTSYSAIRNNPNAQRLLRENVELKAENQRLQNELDNGLMELTMLIAMGG